MSIDILMKITAVVAAVTILSIPPGADSFSAGSLSNPCDWDTEAGQLCDGIGGLGQCSVGTYTCKNNADNGAFSSCVNNQIQVDCGDYFGCAQGNRDTAETNATGCLTPIPVF